ncbi:helix-turn-helix transcriptional regulator [Kitasatospora sp. NPDC096128]|uniref:helix-turn-helix transcriptional regulator n=1 Tax=Kitasatospora sp. NPDC096128 TaxID=3155547 RepID=UPI003327C5BE
MTTAYPGQIAVRGLPCPDCHTTHALTRGELAILDNLARGATTDDIGRLLNPGHDPDSLTSSNRIYRAINDVLHVLGAKTRVHAVDIGCRTQLLTMPSGVRPPVDGVTAQQVRTAALLASGLTYQEIAEQLGVPDRTVRSRLNRLYADLGAAGGPHAVWSLHAIGALPAHHPCSCRSRAARR